MRNEKQLKYATNSKKAKWKATLISDIFMKDLGMEES